MSSILRMIVLSSACLFVSLIAEKPLYSLNLGECLAAFTNADYGYEDVIRSNKDREGGVDAPLTQNEIEVLRRIDSLNNMSDETSSIWTRFRHKIKPQDMKLFQSAEAAYFLRDVLVSSEISAYPQVTVRRELLKLGRKYLPYFANTDFLRVILDGLNQGLSFADIETAIALYFDYRYGTHGGLNKSFLSREFPEFSLHFIQNTLSAAYTLDLDHISIALHMSTENRITNWAVFSEYIRHFNEYPLNTIELAAMYRLGRSGFRTINPHFAALTAKKDSAFATLGNGYTFGASERVHYSYGGTKPAERNVPVVEPYASLASLPSYSDPKYNKAYIHLLSNLIETFKFTARDAQLALHAAMPGLRDYSSVALNLSDVATWVCLYRKDLCAAIKDNFKVSQVQRYIVNQWVTTSWLSEVVTDHPEMVGINAYRLILASRFTKLPAHQVLPIGKLENPAHFYGKYVYLYFGLSTDLPIRERIVRLATAYLALTDLAKGDLEIVDRLLYKIFHTLTDEAELSFGMQLTFDQKVTGLNKLLVVLEKYAKWGISSPLHGFVTDLENSDLLGRTNKLTLRDINTIYSLVNGQDEKDPSAIVTRYLAGQL